jgi:hypothetical protein
MHGGRKIVRLKRQQVTRPIYLPLLPSIAESFSESRTESLNVLYAIVGS